jgi:hypothetical protein
MNYCSFIVAVLSFTPLVQATSFSQGFLIGYVTADIKKSYTNTEPIIYYNFTFDTSLPANRFPPDHQYPRCFDKQYKIIEFTPFDIIGRFILMVITIIAYISLCLYSSVEEREIIAGVCIGSFVHSILNDDDDY